MRGRRYGNGLKVFATGSGKKRDGRRDGRRE